MLADVLKQREQIRQQELQEENHKYEKPYKRDTIIYYCDIHVIGGIETWIYNLAKRYEFSVLYDKADKAQLERLESIGVETIKNVGQPIECNTLICPVFNRTEFIKAKKRILFIHGMYDVLKLDEVPEHDEIYAVSKGASEAFYKTHKIKSKVLYNHIDVEDKIKPLIIGVFSRLSAEKGKWRVQYLIEKLQKSGKPFLMLIFTDLPFECDDNRVVFIRPELNPYGWMGICDYICQLSDTEAGCITAQEALKLSKPLLITRLPILDEFGINEKNAKIYDFDMSSLDIDDLWNIPVVKNFKEPESEEWDKIMKKRVFREKHTEEPKVETKKPEIKRTIKTTKGDSKWN